MRVEIAREESKGDEEVGKVSEGRWQDGQVQLEEHTESRRDQQTDRRRRKHYAPANTNTRRNEHMLISEKIRLRKQSE